MGLRGVPVRLQIFDDALNRGAGTLGFCWSASRP